MVAASLVLQAGRMGYISSGHVREHELL